MKPLPHCPDPDFVRLRDALKRETECRCAFNCDADDSACMCLAHQFYRAVIAPPAEPK